MVISGQPTRKPPKQNSPVHPKSKHKKTSLLHTSLSLFLYNALAGFGNKRTQSNRIKEHIAMYIGFLFKVCLFAQIPHCFISINKWRCGEGS